MGRQKAVSTLDRRDNNWSDCGMVFYNDRRAYAIDKQGKLWDVGDQDTVRDTLITGVIAPDLCHDNRREALQIALDYRREEGYGERNKNTGRTGLDRTSVARVVRHKQSDARQTAPGKRTPLYPPDKQEQGLPG